MSSLTLASSFAIVVALLYLSGQAESGLDMSRKELRIIVFFQDYLSSDEAEEIVKSEVSEIQEVAGTRFTSREEALQSYVNATGEDVVSILGKNPLPANASLTLKSPSANSVSRVLQRLRGINGIAKAEYDAAKLAMLEARSESLWKLSMSVVLLCGVATFASIFAASRLSAQLRVPALHLTRLLGGGRLLLYGQVIGQSLLAALLGIPAGYLLFILFRQRLLPFLDPSLGWGSTSVSSDFFLSAAAAGLFLLVTAWGSSTIATWRTLQRA